MTSINIKGYTNEKAKKLVTIAYYTILNRPPDSSGLAHFTKLLTSGKFDETDLSYALFTSKEYQSKFIKQVK